MCVITPKNFLAGGSFLNKEGPGPQAPPLNPPLDILITSDGQHFELVVVDIDSISQH